MDFYDQLAGEYDRMTGAARRGRAAEEFIRELLDRFPVADALDVACGTGLFTLPLAARGVRTVGADLSPGMLDRAKRNAQRAGVDVDWICAPMQELAPKTTRRFDAVLCMGNSLPHLLAEEDLDAAIGGMVGLLQAGGVVVLDLLNYARVLARGERIVGIDRDGDRQYVRFYDFLPDRVRFNVLKIAWDRTACSHELHATLLRPYTARTLADALRRHGCSRVELCAGLDFSPFDPSASETVLLLGHKS